MSISETKVRRLIGAGILPAVAGAIRIEQDELADWISERRTAAESTVGSGSLAETAMGRGNSVDAPAERDGTSSSREAVEPAQLAGNER